MNRKNLIIEFSKEYETIGKLHEIQLKKSGARLKFIKAFPDTPIFDEYIAPNTYLFVGRYYDKNDAIAFQKTITSAFSNTMVIKKRILPPLLKK